MPNNCLSVLYKHIIQVENKNVGVKVCVCVCGGGGGGHIHTIAPQGVCVGVRGAGWRDIMQGSSLMVLSRPLITLE